MYYMQYKLDGLWIAFAMRAASIYEALDWMKANVQEESVCATKMN